MRVSCNPIVSIHLHVTQGKHVAAKEMVGTCMARECHEPYALFHRTFTSTASVCVPGRYDHGGQRDPRSSAPHCCSATQHRNSATQAPPTVAARRDAATPRQRLTTGAWPSRSGEAFAVVASAQAAQVLQNQCKLLPLLAAWCHWVSGQPLLPLPTNKPQTCR